MELETLEIFNPWWTAGQVKTELTREFRRPLFSELLNFFEERQILLVYGLRRVGKTTLFYQLIEHLLNDGVGPEKIVYFSFDE
ncbi:MAG: AAA family ATPase, partial [Thermoplasmata archaeon]|nr:AAA family ATPase [Thermoplasmata archaeon]